MASRDRNSHVTELPRRSNGGIDTKFLSNLMLFIRDQLTQHQAAVFFGYWAEHSRPYMMRVKQYWRRVDPWTI